MKYLKVLGMAVCKVAGATCSSEVWDEFLGRTEQTHRTFLEIYSDLHPQIKVTNYILINLLKPMKQFVFTTPD